MRITVVVESFRISVNDQMIMIDNIIKEFYYRVFVQTCAKLKHDGFR